MPRYLFVLPDEDRPIGGMNVALQMVRMLSAAGYEAFPLFGSSHYVYRFAELPVKSYFFPPLAKVPLQAMLRRKELQSRIRDITSFGQAQANERLEIAPDDVFVVPEFLYPEYSALFSQNRLILLSQDVLAFGRALARDIKGGGHLLDGFERIITTSIAAQAAVAQLGQRASGYVPLAVARAGLDPQTPKKRQIAYMPRKRSEEIDVLLGCLAGDPAFADWTFRKIEKVSTAERDQILNESLMFLSFSFREGFGLPPAEAMAAGCIAIGYTGVGGEEYFQSETGIRIADGDIVAFAAALKDAVATYEADATALDALRHHAATEIAARYTVDSMRAALLDVWAQMDDGPPADPR